MMDESHHFILFIAINTSDKLCSVRDQYHYDGKATKCQTVWVLWMRSHFPAQSQLISRYIKIYIYYSIVLYKYI